MKSLLLLIMTTSFLACQKDIMPLDIQTEEAVNSGISEPNKIVYALSDFESNLMNVLKEEQVEKGIFQQAEIFCFDNSEVIRASYEKDDVIQYAYFIEGNNNSEGRVDVTYIKCGADLPHFISYESSAKQFPLFIQGPVLKRRK